MALRQTDVESTQHPTASLAFGAASTKGACTRWSSSGCSNLDGFSSPGDAEHDQYEIDQYVQELAFKWRGFSMQQEWHHKTIKDNLTDEKYDLIGGYVQSGYFFQINNLVWSVGRAMKTGYKDKLKVEHSLAMLNENDYH